MLLVAVSILSYFSCISENGGKLYMLVGPNCVLIAIGHLQVTSSFTTSCLVGHRTYTTPYLTGGKLMC